MTEAPAVIFLLDSPNVWRGRALAGTPARVLALAGHSHQAGAAVTLVLCDRGADYGGAADWPFDVVLAHPADYYAPASLARVLEPARADFLIMCEAEAVAADGREMARQFGAALVYDVHDDEAAVAVSLGEPPEIVERYRVTQRSALRSADHVIVSTRNEAHLVAAALVPAARTALLPNGADPRQRHCWGPDVSAATMVFLGNLYYQPNARAVAAIRGTILPSLRASGVSARVRVVGRGPAELTRPGDGVEFTGRVDSIDDALNGVTLALAPLTAGSGAKMKVADYLAAGLPVVGTSQAVTGLPPGHPGVVVEDDLSAWPGLLAALLIDGAALREIGQAGRHCVERELSWQMIGLDLVRHARRWLAAPPPAARLDPENRHAAAPRWLTEHLRQGAVPEPRATQPGQPRWLRRGPATARPARPRGASR